MAGQGIQRREMLQILGVAAAAARFPGFSKWGFACGHIGRASLQIKPGGASSAIFHGRGVRGGGEAGRHHYSEAFSLGTSEHLIENFRHGERKAA